MSVDLPARRIADAGAMLGVLCGGLLQAGLVTTGGALAALPDGSEPSAPQRPPLEEIVVVASKTERPLAHVAAQVTTVDRERLAAEQVQQLGQVARYEPALEADFDTPRFGATGLSIRGIGGNRVALELDGVPLPQHFDVGSFASSSRAALDPAVIRRIEILRGPASALYGSDAIGGVVAITTVDGYDLVPAGRARYLGASTGYFGGNDAALGQLTYAGAGSADAWVLSLGYRTGAAPRNQARTIPSDRVDFHQGQVFAKWTHDFDDGGALRASADYFERNVDSELRALLGFERFANTSHIAGDDRQRRDRLTVAYALPELPWLDQGSVMVYRQTNTTEQKTDEQRTARGVPVKLRRDFSLHELGYGGELRGRWNFSTGRVIDHVLVAGIEWDHQRLTERRNGLQTDLLTGMQSTSLLGEQFPLRDFPESTTDEIGVYLQDELVLGRFSLIPALRWDYFELDAGTDGVFKSAERLVDLDADKLSLRFGVTYRPADSLALYVQYSEGFRAPPAEDVNLFLDIPRFNYRAIPNPDLKPEQSRNVEAGGRFARDGTLFEASIYYSEFEDFIESRVNLGPDPVTGGLVFQSRNLAAATIYGVEATLSQELGVLHPVLAAWSLDAGFHWARGENDVSGAPLNSINPLKAVFGLHWQPDGSSLAASLRIRHLGSQSRVDFSNDTFFVPPPATVLDLAVHWTAARDLDWRLGVYNLTDQRYWRYADVRNFPANDPRVELASRPGLHAALTVDLRF